MKKVLLVSAIIASSVITPIDGHAVSLEAKQAGVATGGLAAGALIGGPVGFLAAFIGTIYVSEQMENNAEAAVLEQKWLASQAELKDMSSQLHLAHNTIENFDSITLEQLELQVMFKTGEDQLSEQNSKALNTLAKFLVENPELSVRLDGYADPRGTDEYNNVLSQYRARTVLEALVAAGVDPQRVDLNAHGSSSTLAVLGDTETYALERRVDIQVINPAEHKSLAQAH
ncbi:OmpA family protein [Gilvimarinus polysaccharolyticus]|uniref:OmpA family protein n=1 Tax=Gilvimarinus polysaccharolyticus TaxID=863921 RepID=UPI0006731DF2|nr:OmpA family protein [Gilvimarinus polysaccharolyticus]